MITRRMALSAVALFCAAGLPVLASNRQTGRETRGVKLADVSDARLRRAMSVRAIDRPLRDWLTEVGREAGVELRIGSEYEDRPITVRADGLPLDRLLDSVAALYGDLWKSEGKASRAAYVLEASPTRRARQKQLLAAYKATLGQQLIDVARDIAKNGPPDWLLEDYGPDERQHATRELKARGAVLALVSPEAMSQLIDGEPMRVRLTDATGAAGDALWDFAESFAMPDASGWKPQQRANSWVHFTADPYMLRGGPVRGLPMRRLAFTFGTPRGASSAYTLVVRPERFAAALDEKIRNLTKGEEQDPDERRKLGGALFQERVPVRESLMQAVGATRGAAVVRLAETVGLSIVSDSHIKPPIAAVAVPGLTVENAFSAVSEAHACYWRVDDGIVRIRSRHWWVDDLAEPPATALQRWRAALDTAGRLSLDDSLQVGALTNDQQERLARVLPETRSAFGPWLRFYGLLSTTQRRAAEARGGLRLWTVPEPQRHVLVDLSAGDSMLGNSAAEETLHGGAAILRVASEPLRTSSRDRRAVDALSFAVDPVPDAAGRLHGARLKVRVILPRRQAAQSQPAESTGGFPQESLPRRNR